ncbi:MAG: hypothetical protein ACM3Q1_01305 [Bacteroidales bacterium]
MTARATFAALILMVSTAWAADPLAEGAESAAKAAQIETLRVRLGAAPSPDATATLLEAENLLRQLGAAPATKRDALRAQLDTALARLELEADAAGRRRP